MKENNQNNIHNFIQYNETIRPQMLDITSPLRDKLKIQFHCTRIYPDGHYFDLGHQIDFLKKSYAHDLMSQGSFFINEFDAFKTNNNYISLWPTHPKDPYLQWLYDSDIWQGFEIYEKQDSYIQIWTFVASRSQENITNFYLNNTSLLKEFIFYFKEKGGYILDSLPKECLPFSDAYKSYFTLPTNQDALGIKTLLELRRLKIK